MSNNLDIVKHIYKYTKEIQQTITRFGNSENIFLNDIDYKKSVCMSLLQIGELTSKLSENYKSETKEIMNWSAIKALRNVFAHAYGSVRYHDIWEICQNDIPVLQSFCSEQIKQLEAADKKNKTSTNALSL